MKKIYFINLSVLCILLTSVLCPAVTFAEDIPDVVKVAIAKFEAKVEGVKPLDPEQAKKLTEELSKFYAWQVSRGSSSDGQDIQVAETHMVGLQVGVSFDAQGKPAGKFHSCNNKSLVEMKDGTQYLFYADQWWQIPSEKSGE